MRAIDYTITNYYVVPVKHAGSDDSGIETCYYFDEDWKSVPSKLLKDTKQQNLVCIRQMAVDSIPEDVRPRLEGFVATMGHEFNAAAQLFSANAKTLGGTAGLNNLFLAVDETIGHTHVTNAWSVTIPVAPRTRRGVILVFRLGGADVTGALIASSDPEVESGSSN